MFDFIMYELSLTHTHTRANYCNIWSGYSF